MYYKNHHTLLLFIPNSSQYFKIYLNSTLGNNVFLSYSRYFPIKLCQSAFVRQTNIFKCTQRRPANFLYVLLVPLIAY